MNFTFKNIFALIFELLIVITCISARFDLLMNHIKWTNLLKFLTEWNFTFTLVYFFFASIKSIVNLFSTSGNKKKEEKAKSQRKEKKEEKKIQEQKTTLLINFFTFAMTICLLMTIVFWVLFNLDRELIFPQAQIDKLPKYFNHVLHTLPMIAITIEYLINPKHLQQPISIKCVLSITFVFLVSYIAIIAYVYHTTKAWIYPFIGLLPLTYLIAFFLVTILFAVLLSFFIIFLIRSRQKFSKREKIEKQKKQN
ncbi:androgen-induced protein 1-related [Anaeramoeba flamelloides]|uniref:Androgen-induced protein 1-related n=1 Tax=Anaeramoeba flamelloides TaxID=1746091 RepID=A0AAV8ABY1_9EUKA|nr:androgen-induced protein 1-related [Anaeramoeba flamelloides]